MKRVLALMLLVLLGAGGIWLAQPEQRPLLAQLNRQATNLSRDASRQVQVQLRDTASAAEPSAPELTKYEKLLCDLANQERRKRGLSPMAITPALAEVARGHSREMMQKDYFSHTSPTAARRNPLDRYKLKYKRSPRLVAENIYMLNMLKGPSFYKLTERDFRRAHEGWMKSPGHRANILRAEPMSPRHIGVGVVVRNGSFWATQNFATP